MALSSNTNNQQYGAHGNNANLLVINITENLISVCEFLASQNTPLFIHHTPFTIDNKIEDVLLSVIKHFNYFEKPFNTVLINFSTHLFTLCPTHLFDNEHKKDFLEFNVGQLAEQVVVVNDIGADIKLLFAINETLLSMLDSVFPQHQLKHSLSVLSQLMLQGDEFEKETILLAIQDNNIEIVVKQGAKLLLANQYSTKTIEDILYYVLFILEQYEFNPLFVNITVVGNCETTSAIIIALKKYIKHITLAKGNKAIVWQNLQGMPQHFNFTLLNRLFCE